MRCDHCSHDVPDGVFCTRCGAHQGTTEEFGDAKTREHRYAAHPGEHVAHASIFTTIFPHLGHHKVHEFRWAFIAGLAGIMVLYLAGLITSAILVAAFLVPILYLIYLYEAQVYRDEPATVLGFTIGGGLVVGIVITILTRVVYNPFPVTNPLGGAAIDIGALFVVGLLLPVIQEAVKPLPAYFLPNRKDFPETVDGLVFGIASGLGFSLAETLIGFSSTITSLPAHVAPGNWIYSLVTIAVLSPLLQGSCTGMIVATIWRQGLGKFSGREIGAIAMAVVAHIAFAGGSLIMRDTSANPLAILIWQAVVDGALLIYIRYLLHHSLLEEAAHMGFAETVCSNCHMHIYASGFCPNCGVALTAAPNSLKRNRRPRRETAATAKSEGA